MPEVWANLLTIAIPIPSPLSILLILVVDLGFELFMALSYAWDVPENRNGMMKLRPRKPVTDRSMAKLRRKESEKLQGKVDPESGTTSKPTFSARARKGWRDFKKIFTKQYWNEAFEEADEEVLVDMNLISYAYLEIGSISTIGCLTAFFVALFYSYGITPSDAVARAGQDIFFRKGAPDYTLASGVVVSATEQIEAFRQGNGIYYLSIMIIQMFNLFACKARLGYPFGRHMFAYVISVISLVLHYSSSKNNGNLFNAPFRNPYSFASIIFGGLTGFFFAYVPRLGDIFVFDTSYLLSPLLWLIPIAFGIILLAYATLRIWILRKSRPIKYNKEVIGLQMFPTKWSTH